MKRILIKSHERRKKESYIGGYFVLDNTAHQVHAQYEFKNGDCLLLCLQASYIKLGSLILTNKEQYAEVFCCADGTGVSSCPDGL